MASYNRIKASKSAPIGTIMPYTGSTSQSNLSADGIPRGWVVCRNQQLKAKEYPLLAQILGNKYGPFTEPGQPFVGIQNQFPNYDDDDVFNLPDLSQVCLIDLEGSRLTPAEQVVIGQYVSANGTTSQLQPSTNIVSYIDITFSVDVSSELAGKIKGIDFEEPAYFDTIRTIPRKLGVEHTAAHSHQRPAGGNYPSVELGGGYIGVFEAGDFDVQDSEYTTGSSSGLNAAEPQADRFNPGTVRWTVYDEAATTLPTMDGFRDFTNSAAAVPIVPTVPRNIAQYGNTIAYQDDNSCIVNVQQPAITAPFPPAGLYAGQRNHYSSTQVPVARGQDATKPYPVTLNHTGDAFTSSSLGSHNHFTIDISMDKGQMDLPGTLLINNMTTGNVEPISVDRGLSVQINPNTPTQVVLYIIRAY